MLLCYDEMYIFPIGGITSYGCIGMFTTLQMVLKYLLTNNEKSETICFTLFYYIFRVHCPGAETKEWNKSKHNIRAVFIEC